MRKQKGGAEYGKEGIEVALMTVLTLSPITSTALAVCIGIAHLGCAGNRDATICAVLVSGTLDLPT